MKFNARVGLQFVHSVQRGIESNQIKHLFRSREALNQNEDRNSGSISSALNTFPRCPHNGVHIYAGVISPKYNFFFEHRSLRMQDIRQLKHNRTRFAISF